MQQTGRWDEAQKYEKQWWHDRASEIDCAFYRDYATTLAENLDGILTVAPDLAILEIGSGAAGILTHLDAAERCAVDPLEYFYSTVETFTRYRDPKVKYQTAKAEALPFEDEKFNLIIIDNVLDHCDDADKAFQEMSRVLRSKGKIYLRLNVYSSWGRAIRYLVEKLKIDPGHPYSFTNESIREYFGAHAFSLLKTVQNGFWNTWWKEVRSGQIKELMKAFTFSTPNKSTFILEKE